jgi:hypothetical protein
MRAVALILALVFATVADAVDTAPGFETQDLEGTTAHFNGSLTTSSVAVPTTGTTIISELLFKCPYQTPTTRNCQISFDGGTTFFTIDVGEFIAWSVKGRRTQVHVKSNTASTSYIMVINREGY